MKEQQLLEQELTLQQDDERDRGVIFKNCASFINCKAEINNETDNKIGNA